MWHNERLETRVGTLELIFWPQIMAVFRATQLGEFIFWPEITAVFRATQLGELIFWPQNMAVFRATQLGELIFWPQTMAVSRRRAKQSYRRCSNSFRTTKPKTQRKTNRSNKPRPNSIPGSFSLWCHPPLQDPSTTTLFHKISTQIRIRKRSSYVERNNY